MPRTRSTEIELRDQEIVAAARKNSPRRDIAQKYGITEARVSQIITANLDPKYPDEDLRAWLLEGYFGDMSTLQEIKDGPGRAITSGKGDHVRDGNTGDFAYDPSPRIDAIRTFAQVRKNVAMLMGSEKQVSKAPEETPGLTEALEWLERTAKENEILKEQNRVLASRLAALERQDLHEAEVIESAG